MSNNECTRPSLGRMANIGDLYDVRTEKLMLSNIFKANINQFVERSVSSSNGLVYDSSTSTKSSENLRQIGIDGDASLSLLCGIMDASGSVSFFKDQIHSERAVQCHEFVRKTTKKDYINYKQSGLEEYYEFSGHEHATHVIVGITWGANATITFTNFNNSGHDKRKITQKMSLELKKLQFANIGDVKAHLNTPTNDDNKVWKSEETKITVHTDVPPPDKSLPQTIEDARKFIDTITAEKDGKQQTFHLLPISSLSSFLKINSNFESRFTSISTGRIQIIESLFDEIDGSYGQMKDLWADINNTSSIPRDEKNMFFKHLHDMANDIAKIKDDIREMVLKVRATNEDPSIINKRYTFIQENSIASHANFDAFLYQNRSIIERAKFLRDFESKGAKTASNDCRLSEIKRNNIKKNTYILFCSFEKERNNDRITTFCKLMDEQKSQDCFVVVEIDTWDGPADEIPQTVTIQLVVDGKLVDSDYNPNTRYLRKKEFSMEDLEKLLQKSGTFVCNYQDFGFTKKVVCCVEVDNFTRKTLKFVGSEELHGWFIYTTEKKDVLPGHRFVFVTRKQQFSLYGAAVMCAWRYQKYLITASWQIPLSGIGGVNSVCIGITNADVKFDIVSQANLIESQNVHHVEGHVTDYYTAGIQSGLFSTIQKRKFISGVESMTIKNNDIKITVRMTKATECNLSIQIFPRNINNYASNLIQHVTV